MFDAAVVCVMRASPAPLASCEALREVKALIFGAAVTRADNVIQAQHSHLRGCARWRGSSAFDF
jgi:hypothetical protein